MASWQGALSALRMGTGLGTVFCANAWRGGEGRDGMGAAHRGWSPGLLGD